MSGKFSWVSMKFYTLPRNFLECPETFRKLQHLVKFVMFPFKNFPDYNNFPSSISDSVNRNIHNMSSRKISILCYQSCKKDLIVWTLSKNIQKVAPKQKNLEQPVQFYTTNILECNFYWSVPQDADLQHHTSGLRIQIFKYPNM